MGVLVNLPQFWVLPSCRTLPRIIVSGFALASVECSFGGGKNIGGGGGSTINTMTIRFTFVQRNIELRRDLPGQPNYPERLLSSDVESGQQRNIEIDRFDPGGHVQT